MAGIMISATLDRLDSGTSWGFRMQGGKDFSSPITIAKVNPGSLAEKCGLQTGDVIKKIGTESTEGMKHKSAQELIIRSGNKVEFILQRGATFVLPGAKTVTSVNFNPNVPPLMPPLHDPYPSPAPYVAFPAPVVIHEAPPRPAVEPTSFTIEVSTSSGEVQSFNTAPAPFSPSVESISSQTSSLSINNRNGYASPSESARYQETPNEGTPQYRGYTDPNVQSRSFNALQSVVQSGQAPPAPPPPAVSSFQRAPASQPMSQRNQQNAPMSPSQPMYHQTPPQHTAPAHHVAPSMGQRGQGMPHRDQPQPMSPRSYQPMSPGGFASHASPKSPPISQHGGYAPHISPKSPPISQQQPKPHFTPVIISGDPCEPGPARAVVHAQYNSPMGLYSANNVSSTYQKQVQGIQQQTHKGKKLYFKEPALSRNVQVDVEDQPKQYVPSDTWKLVHEQDVPKQTDFNDSPGQAHSRTFKKLEQQMHGTPQSPQSGYSAPAAKPFSPPVPKATGASPAKWAPSKPTGPRNPKVVKKGGAQFQQPVAGGMKIPICSSCGAPIRGPFVLALGKSWCPDHFICANPNCGTKLVDIGFVEENGKLYCEKDYEQFFAPECSKCKSPIVGDTVNALEKQWHPHCFVCIQCKSPITSGNFHVENGEPYCESDWFSMFQTKCFGCDFPIEPGDRCVDAISQNWHSECFNCSTCQINLEGKPFVPKNGRPFCQKHAR